MNAPTAENCGPTSLPVGKATLCHQALSKMALKIVLRARAKAERAMKTIRALNLVFTLSSFLRHSDLKFLNIPRYLGKTLLAQVCGFSISKYQNYDYS